MPSGKTTTFCLSQLSFVGDLDYVSDGAYHESCKIDKSKIGVFTISTCFI